MNEILSLKSDECNVYTVFITKLSRIGEQCTTSGNKYIGFQGGKWNYFGRWNVFRYYCQI